MMALLLHDVPRHALVLLGLVLARADRGASVRQRLPAHRPHRHSLLCLHRHRLECADGFAGQLSLGHALYVGLGAYTTAALYVHFGIGPWVGMPVAILISVASGMVIGFLAFRFGVAGVYFAILTIAFCEFARIGFDHFGLGQRLVGLFLPVANYSRNDLLNLRGQPVMFYYVILALTAVAFVLCHMLLRSRVGYFWQAIREDEVAARSLGINTFRYKMIAIAISSA